MATNLPLPDFFKPERVGEVWRVPYQQRAAEAADWAQQHHLAPAAQDQERICLLLVDVQNTFCIPGFELFVGGRSGLGAVEDNTRLCEFIYRHLGQITTIVATLDTHTAMQIFHPIFWVDGVGAHPAPMTTISLDELLNQKWQVNPALATSLHTPLADLQAYGEHYVRQLSQEGKYPLTVWPYHSMLGGIGHALVPAVEEALFFHTLCRQNQTEFEIKGNNPLTENYSALRPEVVTGAQGEVVAEQNTPLLRRLLDYDALIIAGQAKSHCVAWTVADLLSEISAQDPGLASKVYLLTDCTSPVVVPGVVDYTEAAEGAFAQFAAAGMHLVNSMEPMEQWLKFG